MSFLKSGKRGILTLCEQMGLSELCLGSEWRHQRLLILGYHGISRHDEHNWDPHLYMPESTFRERMEALREHRCHVLSLEEGVQRVFAGTLPERSVCITFDDGFVDFQAQALPILNEFGFPSTLYLTTYYGERNLPVFPLMCSYVLWRGRGQILSGWDEPGLPKKLDLTSQANRASLIKELETHATRNKLDALERDQLMEQLASRTGVDYQQLRAIRFLHLMNGEEVRSVASAGVDVQMHSHRHRAPTERSLYLREISENSKRIEGFTGRRPSHFCYPGGLYREEFLPWLKELGVKSGTTCRPGLATRNDNPLLLPRIVDTCGLSTLEFESWIAGFAAALPRRALFEGAS
jgi:peptidoglycan/xylan/chitin deacetylase (PgdA/CDA1 family)